MPTKAELAAGVEAAREFDHDEGRYTDIDWDSEYARELVAAILAAAKAVRE